MKLVERNAAFDVQVTSLQNQTRGSVLQKQLHKCL